MNAYHLFPPVTPKVRGVVFPPHDNIIRSRGLACFLSLFMIGSMVGCMARGLNTSVNEADSPTDTTGRVETETEQATTAAVDTAEGSYPQIHTDVLGREVATETRPERIVSLAPSVTEILFAIGAGPQVVGRTEHDNYPPEAQALPTVGGFGASTLSVETILSLQPDLVLSGSRRQEEVVRALDGAGLTVFTLAPESLADIETGILTVGQITGNAQGAEALVANMRSRIDAVVQTVQQIPDAEKVTVFYEVWHEPLTTTSNATYIGELLLLAGADNIFGDLQEAYPTVSAEQIVTLNPQVIVGPSSHSDQLTVEAIAERPGWWTMTAVQDGAIYIVDADSISRPGPRVVDALEQLATALYPNYFNGAP